MRVIKYLYTIALVLLLQVSYGCNSAPTKSVTTTVVKPTGNSVASVKPNVTNDEQQFRQFLKRFKDAVKARNKAQLMAFFNFPLQTNPQWTNEDLKNSSTDHRDGLIGQSEFATYFNDVFTNQTIKLIPAIGENDLSEIDRTTTENYYITLRQVTDKGSTLYEMQQTYAEDNGKETSFGFVFGKVGGSYKAISYYRPWPLKG
jgi:hypothetical protein